MEKLNTSIAQAVWQRGTGESAATIVRQLTGPGTLGSRPKTVSSNAVIGRTNEPPSTIISLQLLASSTLISRTTQPLSSRPLPSISASASTIARRIDVPDRMSSNGGVTSSSSCVTNA
eukprot:COSAG04_NODE_4275_length_2190_cov_3.585366_2_plen_118_part_00